VDINSKLCHNHMLQCKEVISIILSTFSDKLNSTLLNLFSLKVVCEVNLAPTVSKMLSNCDNIIQQHKQACLRITSLLACKDIIWIGTSAGVLLTLLTQNLGKNTPVVTGKTHLTKVFFSNFHLKSFYVLFRDSGRPYWSSAFSHSS
jgi:WD40 repeated domain